MPGYKYTSPGEIARQRALSEALMGSGPINSSAPAGMAHVLRQYLSARNARNANQQEQANTSLQSKELNNLRDVLMGKHRGREVTPQEAAAFPGMNVKDYGELNDANFADWEAQQKRVGDAANFWTGVSKNREQNMENYQYQHPDVAAAATQFEMDKKQKELSNTYFDTDYYVEPVSGEVVAVVQASRDGSAPIIRDAKTMKVLEKAPDGAVFINSATMLGRNRINVNSIGTLNNQLELDQNQALWEQKKQQMLPVAFASVQSRGASVDFVNEQAQRIKDRVGVLSTGLPGQLLQYLGGSDANWVRAELNTLRGAAAFDKLQELRDLGGNGSSGLGQVTEREIKLLEAAFGAIDPSTSAADFKAQITRFQEQVVNSWDKVMAAYEAEFGAEYNGVAPQGSARSPGTIPGSPAGTPPTTGGNTYRYTINGERIQ